MSKQARNRKALERSLKRLANAVVKLFEPTKSPLEFLTKDVVNDSNKQYNWKILNDNRNDK